MEPMKKTVETATMMMEGRTVTASRRILRAIGLGALTPKEVDPKRLQFQIIQALGKKIQAGSGSPVTRDIMRRLIFLQASKAILRPHILKSIIKGEALGAASPPPPPNPKKRRRPKRRRPRVCLLQRWKN